jgi:hypothetical protein
MNKGLVKLKKIIAKAKVIRENAGKRTVTQKIVKYNMPQKEAVKRAAKSLFHKPKQTKLRFGRATATPKKRK